MIRRRNFTSQSGTSIIEIIVVLTVAAILATFAIAQFGSSKKNLERQNIVHELKVSLERARFDSVKRRAVNANQMASVVINSATSFSLTTDLNQNGTIDAAESRQVDFAGSGINFVGTGLTYPITIRFDRQGFATAINSIGKEISPNFTICKSCTAATANAENSSMLSVSPTGTVLIMTGGEAAPTFKNPEVSPIPVGSHINKKVMVNP